MSVTLKPEPGSHRITGEFRTVEAAVERIMQFFLLFTHKTVTIEQDDRIITVTVKAHSHDFNHNGWFWGFTDKYIIEVSE